MNLRIRTFSMALVAMSAASQVYTSVRANELYLKAL